MKSFKAILLITGILSCLYYNVSPSPAEERIEEQKEGIRLLRSLLSLGNYNYGNKSKEQTEDVMKLLKASCEKNNPGSSTAFDNAQTSLKSFEQCLYNTTGTRGAPVANGNIEGYTIEACRILKNADKCLKSVKDTVDLCLNSEERKATNILYNIINALVQFTCDNEASNIREFFVNDGEACVTKNQSPLLKCIADVSDENSSAIWDSKSINGLEHSLNLVSTEKDCTNMEKFHQCTINSLKDCKNDKPAKITDSLFKSIKTAMECDGFAKSEAFSTSNDINVILASIMMGITSLGFV